MDVSEEPKLKLTSDLHIYSFINTHKHIHNTKDMSHLLKSFFHYGNKFAHILGYP